MSITYALGLRDDRESEKDERDNMHTPGPTIHDTEWRAVLMGSEGWSVFAGPRMIASNLSETNARLIAAAPDLLEALDFAYHLRFVDDTNTHEEEMRFWASVQVIIAKAKTKQ